MLGERERRLHRTWAAPALLVSLILVTWAPCVGAQQAATPTQPPLPQSLDEALVTVVVGDVTGFLDGIDALAGTAEGDESASIGQELGRKMLGEAGLTGFQKGSGMVFVLYPAAAVGFAEVSAETCEAYRAHFAGQGGFCERLESGLLAFSGKPAGIEIARSVEKQVSAMLMMQSRPTAEVRLAPHLAVETFRPAVDLMLAGIAQQIAAAQQQSAPSGQAAPAAPTGAPIRVIEGELRTLLAVADQAERVVLRAAPSDQVLGVDVEVVPVADTALARFCEAPVPAPALDMLGLFGADGAVRGVAAINPDAIVAFADSILRQVAAQMGLSMEDTESIRKLMVEPVKSYGSQMAMNLFTPDGEGLVSGSVAMTTRSPEALLDAAEHNTNEFISGGLADFYRDMGMRTEGGFTRDVRTHESIPVHRVEIRQHFESMPPDQAATMSEVMGNLGYEMAFVGKTALYGMGGGSVDALIDAALAGADKRGEAPGLEAARVMPEGGDMYFDVHPFLFAQRVLQPVIQAGGPGVEPSERIAEFLAHFEGAPAMCVAGYSESGRSSVRMRVPGEMVRRFVDAVQPEPDAGASATGSR